MCGFTHEGEKVPVAIIESAYKTYSWILRKADQFYHRMCKGDPVEEAPLGQYVEAEVNNYLLTQNEKERPLLRAIFNQMISRETNINGTNSLDDISLKYYGLYTEIPGRLLSSFSNT